MDATRRPDRSTSRCRVREAAGDVAPHARRPGPARPGTASPRSRVWSRCGVDPRAGGSSATGPTPDGRCTRRSGCRTRACRTWRPASCSTSSATSSASAAPAATTRGSARPCTDDRGRASAARSPRSRARMVAGARRALAPAGVPVDGRVRGVPAPRARRTCFANWFETYGEHAARSRIEQFFEFEFDGVTVIGYIDRIGAIRAGRHASSPTSRPARATTPAKPEDSLQLGIYYLAVQESEDARRVPAGARGGAGVPARQLEDAATSTSASWQITRARRGASTRRRCANGSRGLIARKKRA